MIFYDNLLWFLTDDYFWWTMRFYENLWESIKLLDVCATPKGSVWIIGSVGRGGLLLPRWSTLLTSWMTRSCPWLTTGAQQGKRIMTTTVSTIAGNAGCFLSPLLSTTFSRRIACSSRERRSSSVWLLGSRRSGRTRELYRAKLWIKEVESSAVPWTFFSLISHWQRWRSSKHLVSLFHDHRVFCFVSRPLVHWIHLNLDCDLRSSPCTAQSRNGETKPRCWCRCRVDVASHVFAEDLGVGNAILIILQLFCAGVIVTWQWWHDVSCLPRDMPWNSWCWVTIFQISSCAHVQRSWSWMNCFKKDMAWDQVGLLNFACYLCSSWSSLLVMLDTARFPAARRHFTLHCEQDVSRNRCEHEFAFNFDLSIQLPSMPFPVHQWMQGWFRLALKASSAAHVHGLAPAWKVKLGRNAKLGREVWVIRWHVTGHFFGVATVCQILPLCQLQWWLVPFHRYYQQTGWKEIPPKHVACCFTYSILTFLKIWMSPLVSHVSTKTWLQ